MYLEYRNNKLVLPDTQSSKRVNNSRINNNAIIITDQLNQKPVPEPQQFEFQELLVLARPSVIERLLDEESASVAELEELTGSPIRLQSEGLYAPDQFDVVLM